MSDVSPRPAVHRRPTVARREHTYPPFRAYDVAEAAPGTDPIWLYLRLSKYHKDGADAIERQRLDLTRQLTGEGCWTIMGEYVDNDSASASAARTRRGWKKLNEDLEAGFVPAVAFWKLDRTNRIATQIMEWLGRCREMGITLRSNQDSNEELNTATANSKLMVGIKALFAEIETDTMSVRQRASKAHLAEAGFHHGGMRPFGWMAGPRETDEFGRTGVRLVPHPIEHTALKAAVRLALDGKTLAEIARYWVDEFGIVTYNGRQLYESNILRFLSSPRMVGYRMRNVPEYVRGQQINLMDYIVRDLDGTPVISQEPVCDYATWQKVLRVFNGRSTRKLRRPWGANGVEWILTGILRCPGCGRTLYGGEKRWTTARGVEKYWRTYGCKANARVAKGTCPAGVRVDADSAEAFILAWIEEHLTDDVVRQIQAELANQRSDGLDSELLAEMEAARAERDDLMAKQGTPEFRGTMVGVLVNMLADVAARIESLEKRLAAIQHEDAPAGSGTELLARWPEMTVREKRIALSRVVDYVEVAYGKGDAAERLSVVPKFAALG